MYSLGFVEEWSREAFDSACRGSGAPIFGRRGRGIRVWSALLRADPLRKDRLLRSLAVALERLASLPLENARAFLKKGCAIRLPWCARLPLRSWPQNEDSLCIPLLCDELRKAVSSTQMCHCAMFAARLPLMRSRILTFSSWLSDSNQRMRLFIADTVAEICRKHSRCAAIRRAMTSTRALRAVLHDVSADTFADVRARAAHVIRFLMMANPSPPCVRYCGTTMSCSYAYFARHPRSPF